MPFNEDDIYVAGGKDKIFNLWTPSVRKFDSNSFYNWEQDNVPLYDLEDRTYHLWEKLGWQTSSVEGVILTVSADASSHIVNEITGESAYDVDPNIYTQLSAAIAALPEIIRYPIRIEVCNFGTLGDLQLQNIKCIEQGSLEIVNRNFAKLDWANTVASGTKFDSSSVMASGLSSTDLKEMLSPTNGVAISALQLSAPLASAVGDTRFDKSSYLFLQYPSEVSGSTGATTLKRTSAVNVLFNYNAAPGTFQSTNTFTGDTYGPGKDPTMGNDMSGIIHDGTLGQGLARASFFGDKVETAYLQRVIGFFYGNSLNSVTINNCNGPIYVRNMHVNGTNISVSGASLTYYSTEYGIDINNCQDLVVENCTAWRCKKAGVRINNSRVVLNRGCLTYRNYNVGDRLTVSGTTLAHGLLIEDSDVTLSSGPTAYAPLGSDTLFSFSESQVGVGIKNSTVQRIGGARVGTATTSAIGSVQSFANQIDGFNIKNSNIELDGRLETWHNNNAGIFMCGSELGVGELITEYNKNYGMHLTNSLVIYNKNNKRKYVPPLLNKLIQTVGVETAADPEVITWGDTGDYPGQVHFAWNGVHLFAENSVFKHFEFTPWDGTRLPLGRIKFKLNFKRKRSGTVDLTVPGIMLTKGSTADFVNSTIFTEGFGNGTTNPFDGADRGTFVAGGGLGVSSMGTGNSIYGSCLYAKDNSKAVFKGTGTDITYLDGPTVYGEQKHNALVCADENSTVKFGGPTLFMRGGIDVLAQNNSKMIFEPIKDSFDFLDCSSFGLNVDTQNHTKVDLHSTRSCLVADGNSEISMRDLGAYTDTWLVTPGDIVSAIASSLVMSTNYDISQTSASVSDGHMQFYPNPQLASGLDFNRYNPSSFQKGAGTQIADNQSLPLANTSPHPGGVGVGTGLFALSMGGMCVRVLNHSNVKCKNVHFPAGWVNTSSIYYSYDPAHDPNGCEQLRIWNVDDSSELDMSFASVSGTWPSYAGYHGPSAVYISGDDSVVASAAPSSTPHTNQLSLLDSFGMSGPAGEDQIAAQNSGPFRLYFSPLGPAKFLCYAPRDPEGYEYVAAGEASAGVVYQTLAQGYNPSATCSGLGASATWEGTNGQFPIEADIMSVYASGPTVPNNIYGVLHPSALGVNLSPLTGVGGGAIPGFVAQYPNGEDWYYNTGGAEGDPLSPSFFYVKDMLPRDYYGRVRMDESGVNVFANAKNGTLGTSGRIRLITMYRAATMETGQGGEGTPGMGRGFLSAEEFDLGAQN